MFILVCVTNSDLPIFYELEKSMANCSSVVAVPVFTENKIT